MPHEPEGMYGRLASALEGDWRVLARSNQLPPPGNWRIWLLLAGRGFGKTRSGAEWVRELIEHGRAGRVALVAPTAADARDVMVEGESGLLAISPSWNRPVYEPSRRRLEWPNGAIATTYSADEPERLRGPQHDAAWCDELASWRYPDAWDNLMLGLRLGADPRCVVTTTPKPVKLIRELLKRQGQDVAVTRGSTYENKANLAPAFLGEILRRYEGTRLGRQEIAAELLEDSPGALWRRDGIDARRVAEAPALRRIVVAVDPSGGDGPDADEVGIVAAGVGADGHGYVLADASGKLAPDAWGRKAVATYGTLRADRIVAERNYGGDMVEHVIRTVDGNVPVKMVTASRGKLARAEPVAALYEQGRVHHVGAFPTLEDELVSWVPGESKGSPNRLDALVWALTELMLDGAGLGMLDFYRDEAEQLARGEAAQPRHIDEPVASGGMVRLKAPPGSRSLSIAGGADITVGTDGMVEVPESVAPGLKAMGYRRVWG